MCMEIKKGKACEQGKNIIIQSLFLVHILVTMRKEILVSTDLHYDHPVISYLILKIRSVVVIEIKVMPFKLSVI